MSTAPAPLLLPRPRLSTLIELGLGLTRPSRRGHTGHWTRLLVVADYQGWLDDLDPRHGLTCACPLLAAAVAAGADVDDLRDEHPDDLFSAALEIVAEHVGYDPATVFIPWLALPPIAHRIRRPFHNDRATSLQGLIVHLYDYRLLGRSRVAAIVRDLGY